MELTNSKYQEKDGTKNFNYLMDFILYQILHQQYYFQYICKKHETLTNKSSVQIYVNKIQNKITFKIKSGYYLELLTLKAMKLLGSTERITRDKNGKNVPQL